MIELLILIASLLLLVIVYIGGAVYFKILKKDKFLRVFTWIIFICVVAVYIKILAGTAHSDWADLWYIFIISYLIVYEMPDWLILDAR